MATDRASSPVHGSTRKSDFHGQGIFACAWIYTEKRFPPNLFQLVGLLDDTNRKSKSKGNAGHQVPAAKQRKLEHKYGRDLHWGVLVDQYVSIVNIIHH